MAATRADLLRNGDAAGAGFRCREAALGRLGGNRGYFRYRVVGWDTFGPSVGRGARASCLVHQAAPRAYDKRPKLPNRQG
jgi:hypothetical protein